MTELPNSESREYDVVVIGGGPVGENAAARAARGGLSVALIESELLGGECSYWACMPSKALLRPAAALAAVQRVHGARQAVTGTLDTAAVFSRRDGFTSNWDDSGQADWAEGAGLTVLRGWGRLAGPRTVSVDPPGGAQYRCTARHGVVVCTGSTPVTPPVPGLDSTPHWGSRQATSAKHVPGRLAVLGGGVVASELAQAFARFGSTVTVLERGERLLGRMEPIAGDLVAEALRADGVDLRTGIGVEQVARDGADGEVRLTLPGGEVVVADDLLVATGRRPNSDDIGVETVGLTPGKPLTVTDDGVVQGIDGDWLFAAGDVTGRALLTHQGKYEARVVGDVLATRSRGGRGTPRPWSRYAATADQCAVPQVVFTDPEVAAVGRTAAQASADGFDVDVVDHDIDVAGAMVHADGYQGRARMVVDSDRGVLLGVTFVGQDVSELLHAATIAIVGEVPLHRLWHAVPAYPTISEIWLRLLEAYEG